MALISLIFVIPTVINSSGLLVRQADFLLNKADEGRPFWGGPPQPGSVPMTAPGAELPVGS
jgi:hypothetical protein